MDIRRVLAIGRHQDLIHQANDLAGCLVHLLLEGHVRDQIQTIFQHRLRSGRAPASIPPVISSS